MPRILLAALALAFALPLPARAGADAAPPDRFQSQADCFATTPDYESWLQAVPARADGTPVPRALAETVVPARAFEFARSAFDCRMVTYASEGQSVSGYVVRPKAGPSGAALPLLVYNRGGNGEFGRLDPLQLFRKLLPLAKAGYVVVASQYRDDDEFGGRDVGDVLRLIDLAQGLPGVDAGRVYLLGESRGAMTSYLVARRRSDITAMATVGGATDLLAGLATRPKMERVYRARIPGYERDPRAALTDRSALRWAERLPPRMPVLLLHGEADDRVPVEDSRAMAARLAQLGRPHRLVVYPGDDHGIGKHRKDAHMEILDWFGQAGAQ